MLSHAARLAPLYGRRLVTLTAPRSTRLWFSACGVLGCPHMRHQIPLDRTRYGMFSQGCLSCLSSTLLLWHNFCTQLDIMCKPYNTTQSPRRNINARDTPTLPSAVLGGPEYGEWVL